MTFSVEKVITLRDIKEKRKKIRLTGRPGGPLGPRGPVPPGIPWNHRHEMFSFGMCWNGLKCESPFRDEKVKLTGSPLAPVDPWGPGRPLSPFSPCSPGAPIRPIRPWCPFSPLAPGSPCRPGKPMGPCRLRKGKDGNSEERVAKRKRYEKKRLTVKFTFFKERKETKRGVIVLPQVQVVLSAQQVLEILVHPKTQRGLAGGLQHEKKSYLLLMHTKL